MTKAQIDEKLRVLRIPLSANEMLHQAKLEGCACGKQKPRQNTKQTIIGELRFQHYSEADENNEFNEQCRTVCQMQCGICKGVHFFEEKVTVAHDLLKQANV
jgi:hypothetical protein